MLSSSISLAGITPLLKVGIAAAMNSIGPLRIELEERIPRRVPLSDRLHRVAGRRRSPRASAPASRQPPSASSRRIGAPRLHEWIDMTAPHLRTKRTSCRVAPASSAPRMWRRVPSGLRLVHAALSATLTSSMNLRGRTPDVHGLVVIFTQVSAQAGSHSRSIAKAGSHGPVSCDWPAVLLSLWLLIDLVSSRRSQILDCCDGFSADETPIERGKARRPPPIP